MKDFAINQYQYKDLQGAQLDLMKDSSKSQL